jgi:hypothetical protein
MSVRSSGDSMHYTAGDHQDSLSYWSRERQAALTRAERELAELEAKCVTMRTIVAELQQLKKLFQQNRNALARSGHRQRRTSPRKR